MPEILAVLKRHRRMKRAEISKAVQPLLNRRGYTERPHATGFALNYLWKEGFLSRPLHGTWEITESGQRALIDEEWGRRITSKYEKVRHKPRAIDSR
jgi:repressor of nif and glnA expression